MTRRILREIKLDKIAAVDRPCQEPATVTIMKRDFTSDERQAMADKGEALSDGSFPIATKGDLENAVHAIGRAKDPSKAKAHIIARAKALGATDQLPEGWSVSKSQPDNTGDPQMSVIAKALGLPETATEAEITAAITKAKTDAGKTADLEKANVLLKAKASMSDAEKAHMATLSDKDADDFAGLSTTDRKTKMAKALEGDETFTTTDGSVISKRAVGDGAFTMLKSQDAALKKMQGDLAIEKAARENAVFAKRAGDELAHISGTIEKKSSMLKSIDTMPDADKTYLTEVLKGADAMAKAGFAKFGHRDASEQDDDPTSKLDKMAKAYASEHKVTIEKAMDAVLMTHDGAALYKRAQAPQSAAN